MEPVSRDITGLCFGPYRIIKVFIADQVGQICQAVNLEDHQEVILNLFLLDYVVSDEFKETFQKTCEELKRFEHPHLAPMIDSGLLEKGAYAAYACENAFPLQVQYLLPLPQRLASKIMFQVSAAVEYLHSYYRTHAHLSLSMVWVGSDDQVWLYDTGLHWVVEQEVLKMMPESYLNLGAQAQAASAPEQVFQREPFFQTDIYALGCLYYQLLTGALPYPSQTEIEGRLKSTFLPVQWPAKLPPTLSRASIQCIQRCMAKDPRERFESAAKVTPIFKKLSSGKFVWLWVHPRLMKASPPDKILKFIVAALTILALAGGLGLIYSTPYAQASIQQADAIIATSRVTPTLTPSPTPIPPTATPTPSPTATALPLPTQTFTPLPVAFKVPISAGTLRLLKEENKFNAGFFGSDLPLIYQKHYSVAFSPDSQWLAFTGANYKSWVCNLESSACKDINGKMPLGDPFSTDSSKIAYLNVEQVKTDRTDLKNKIFENVLFLQNLSNNSSTKLGSSVDNGIVGYVHQGSLVLVGNSTQTRAWDMNTGLEILKQEAGESGCQVMRVAYDRSFLSATTVGRVVEEWDSKVQHICSYVVGMKDRLVTLSTDLNRLAYINQYGLVEVYDPGAKQLLWKYQFNSPVTSMSFSPDNSILVVAETTGQLYFFGSKDGSTLSSPDINVNAVVKAIMFSPDSKYLAVLESSPRFDDNLHLYSAVDYK